MDRDAVMFQIGEIEEAADELEKLDHVPLWIVRRIRAAVADLVDGVECDEKDA